MAKATGSKFTQGKVTVKNTAKGNGGVGGSGRSPVKPAKFGSETPGRKNPFGSGAKQKSMPIKGGSKPFSGRTKLLG